MIDVLVDRFKQILVALQAPCGGGGGFKIELNQLFGDPLLNAVLVEDARLL